MFRQYEFSIDSVQVVLNTSDLSESLDASDEIPDIPVQTKWGDYDEVCRHLREKLIFTDQPSHIRGGGLHTYCKLLSRNYNPVPGKMTTEGK
eukprot:TRINITY_DN2924_c0_g1_i1.p1 TRINITY_DN2924_c0_g1~~TRINITY_DN2924_c0_g1_i1.p1  ORF type:complete len:92 (-),score=19.80 TRINITY_DN2924_c0_g1_i1:383-658(-)